VSLRGFWTSFPLGANDSGRHIVSLRKEQGITQAEFADELGISRTTLSSLENGGSVSATLLIRALGRLGSRIVIAPKAATVTVDEGLG
jgi:transcriptional regulator with XRE-family HTH domain